jgi:single-strand DNA-binding protein
MEITGRLVADAAVRTTKTEKKVTGFTIAINDSYRPKNGDRVKITTYIECSYWLNPGIAEYLQKGTLVELFGRMEAGAYTNKDGKAVGTLNFHTEKIKLLGKATLGGTERVDSKATNKQPVNGADEDDLPF